jgi:hypothetical protein
MARFDVKREKPFYISVAKHMQQKYSKYNAGISSQLI